MEVEVKHIARGNFDFLLLTLSISLGLYVIEISDWFLAYEILLDIPLGLTLLCSGFLFVFSVVEILFEKRFPTKRSAIYFVVVALTFLGIYKYRSGLFTGKKLLTAAFLDDRSRMDLELLENGNYVVYSNWLFGEERFTGTYKIEDDTVFLKKSDSEDFIADKMLLDRKQQKIYFRKDENGNYEKSFYYFKISS